MNDYLKRLEEKIRRLKTDARATNSLRRLRIEIDRHGGKWVTESGLVFELRNGVIYQYESDYKEGISNLIIIAPDAPIPYVAELNWDLQGVAPEKRPALKRELEAHVKKLEEVVAKDNNPIVEIVTIVEHDWLTKISLARWGTLDWQRHLKPTRMTLQSRKSKAKTWNPNLIYSGDTFEVRA